MTKKIKSFINCTSSGKFTFRTFFSYLIFQVQKFRYFVHELLFIRLFLISYLFHSLFEMFPHAPSSLFLLLPLSTTPFSPPTLSLSTYAADSVPFRRYLRIIKWIYGYDYFIRCRYSNIPMSFRQSFWRLISFRLLSQKTLLSQKKHAQLISFVNFCKNCLSFQFCFKMKERRMLKIYLHVYEMYMWVRGGFRGVDFLSGMRT